MQTQKMSLANIQGKLSRMEMKNIMAGSCTASSSGYKKCCKNGSCSDCLSGMTCENGSTCAEC